MDATKLNKDRNLLFFIDTVVFHFSFLKNWGFSCVEKNLFNVKFQSKNCMIIFYHDERSYEIEVKFQKPEQIEDYSIFELLKLLKLNNVVEERLFVASSFENVVHGVKLLSNIFQNNFKKCIFKDINLFIQLHNQRVEINKIYYKKMEIEKFRLCLQKAWDKKDYKLVIESAKTINEKDMFQSEIAKICYARNKIKEHGVMVL